MPVSFSSCSELSTLSRLVCGVASACVDEGCVFEGKMDATTVGAPKKSLEKHSVPFPLYGQLFLGTLFARSENGQLYGKSTVAKRKWNRSF